MTTGSFPHDNFSSVYWIFTKLGHMITLWKGKYFGIITIIPFDILYRRAYFFMHTFLVAIVFVHIIFICNILSLLMFICTEEDFISLHLGSGLWQGELIKTETQSYILYLHLFFALVWKAKATKLMMKMQPTLKHSPFHTHQYYTHTYKSSLLHIHTYISHILSL